VAAPAAARTPSRLLFTVDGTRLALECRQVVEVVPRVPLQRMIAAPAALAGFLDYRGTQVPVVDLHSLLADRPCPPERAARIAIVRLQARGRERLTGLLAEGFTRLIAGDLPTQAALAVAGRPYLGGWVRHDGDAAVQLVLAEQLLGEAWLEAILGQASGEVTADDASGAAG
jgi:chemotaxis-related protein WspB